MRVIYAEFLRGWDELSIDFDKVNGVLLAADRFNNAIAEYLGSDEQLLKRDLHDRSESR